MALVRGASRCGPGAALALAFILASAIGACGGTSGHELLPAAPGSPSSGASGGMAPDANDDGPADATPADGGGDSGFDATIEYADAARLNVALEAAAAAAVPEGSVAPEAAAPPWAAWPLCNQDTYDPVSQNEVP